MIWLAQVDGAKVPFAFDTERAAMSWAAKETVATSRTVVVWASGPPDPSRTPVKVICGDEGDA